MAASSQLAGATSSTSQPGTHDPEEAIEVPPVPHDQKDIVPSVDAVVPVKSTERERVSERERDPPARAFDPTSISQRAGIDELFALAHARAPRMGDTQLAWMTISQAAACLRISKLVLASWATRGYIASVKGEGPNAHRIVHIDNVLHYLAECITSRD
jgi:hypothetical protein